MKEQDILSQEVALVEELPSVANLFKDSEQPVFRAISAEEKNKWLLEVRARMLAGDTPEDIAREMGLTFELVQALQAELRRPLIVSAARKTEEQYADFVMVRRGEIEELDKLIQSLQVEVTTDETVPVALEGGAVPIRGPEESLTAAVVRKTAVVSIDPKVQLGAIKRKGEIRNEILEKGQELGIIYKAPEKRQTLSGHVVADLSNQELMNVLLQELQATEELMKLGNQDITGKPISPGGGSGKS